MVGITGSTGRATGDHLHITCRYKGKMRNPCKLLEYITTTKEMCIKILAAKGMPTEGEEEFLHIMLKLQWSSKSDTASRPALHWLRWRWKAHGVEVSWPKLIIIILG